MTTGGCFYCGAPPTHEVEAGRPGAPTGYRAQRTCDRCLDRGRRWASAVGPVTTLRIADDPQQTLFGETG